jgi:hypothetical protein
LLVEPLEVEPSLLGAVVVVTEDEPDELVF